jgi:hypothetical protein
MTEHPQFDDLMREALAHAREAEPTSSEIHEAVARARRMPLRRRPVWRMVGVAAATLALLSASAIAIPPVRDALANGFGALQDFLTGGAPAPGPPIAADEPVGRLNWFDGSTKPTGAVIAESGTSRLIAFRDPSTGLACIGYGLNAEECRTDGDWSANLAASPLILRGPLDTPDSRGRRALIGLTADAITAVELRYVDGGTVRVAGIHHGFVVSVEPARGPSTITARDARGHEVVTIDIGDRDWTAPAP